MTAHGVKAPGDSTRDQPFCRRSIAATRSPTVRTERKSSGLTLRPITRRMRSMRSTASMLSISRSSPRRAEGTTREGSISNSSVNEERSNSSICSELNIKRSVGRVRRAAYVLCHAVRRGPTLIEPAGIIARPEGSGVAASLSLERSGSERRLAGRDLQLIRKQLQQVRVEGSRSDRHRHRAKRRQVDVPPDAEGDPHPAIRNLVPGHFLGQRRRHATDEDWCDHCRRPDRDVRRAPVKLHGLPGRRARPFREYYYIFAVLKGLGGTLDHRMRGRVAHV